MTIQLFRVSRLEDHRWVIHLLTSLAYSEPHSNAPRVTAFGILRMSSAVKCNHHALDVQKMQLSNMSSPAHVSSTLWMGAGEVRGHHLEWVNRTFWDMRSRGRWLIQQGVDIAAVLGDTCPTLLPFPSPPESQGGADYWTVSKWATRFVDNFPHLSHSDRLACWVVMFIIFNVR